MERILSFIGIAQKAGKVKTGEYLTMKALKEFEACLVIIAEDTSEKATARISFACENLECDVRVFGTKESLGHYTGNREKSVICITDEGFAKALIQKIDASKKA